MADLVSDSSIPVAPPQHPPGKHHRTPADKRNNRTRKNYPQMDGAVSDSVVARSTASPQSKKMHRQRQSVAAGVGPGPYDNGMGDMSGVSQRTASVGIPATPSKAHLEPAFAGSAFQASPAPSSLPMPKFFSKSVPNVGRPPLPSRMSGETAAFATSSSPESDAVVPASPVEPPQSPLDMFFKADRAEKEKIRSASHTLSSSAARSARDLTQPLTQYQQPSRSLFMSEPNHGNGSATSGPRPMMPNNRPPVFERAYSSSAITDRPPTSTEERQAYTNSMKNLLFNTASAALSTPPPQTASRPSSGSQTPEGIFGSPSPLQNPVSRPSTPQPSSENQNHYSLHYGNRNLSPLFKAARAETPTRPSSLRQEVPPTAAAPNARFDAEAQSYPPQSNPIDPNTFARSYLQEQIRASGPAEMPQLPFNLNARSGHPSSNTSGAGANPIPVHAPNAQSDFGQPASSSAPRNGASRDMLTIENDLKRRLQLSIARRSRKP